MSDDLIKLIAVDFFRYWYNAPGTNTEQGFDEWWSDYGDNYNGHLTVCDKHQEQLTALREEIEISKATNDDLLIQNIKLRSMCKAAAAEIDSKWDAHCIDGFGPSNLVSRLEGKLKPDFYPSYMTDEDRFIWNKLAPDNKAYIKALENSDGRD